MRRQKVILTPDQYYSRGAFRPTVVTDGGTGISTVTYARGQIDLFSYGNGQPMDPALSGVPSHKATRADTNLTGAAATTIGGDKVLIGGLSIQLTPRNLCARAAGLIFAESCVSFFYDGLKLGLQIGPAYFIPGKSSLYGSQPDNTVPTTTAGDVPQFGFISNGAPSIHNFLRIPERLRWNSAGKVDSNLTLRFELLRDVSFTIGSARAAEPQGAAFVGVPPFVQPVAANGDLDVDIMSLLHSVQVGDRSSNR